MERAGEKEVWEVGAWPPFTQELQLSSGSHFWSWPELSFRDACAQPVPSWSRPWHDLQPNSSLQTCLAPLGCGWPCTRYQADPWPWDLLSSPGLGTTGLHLISEVVSPTCFAHHLPPPPCLPCGAACSCCSLTLGSWHLHQRYARTSFYSLQCRCWTKWRDDFWDSIRLIFKCT